MKKLLVILFMVMVVICACSKEDKPDNFVLIEGGTFTNDNSNYFENSSTIANYYISKYEVTQKEWVDIMGTNPSQFVGDNLPVEMVSWYDSIEYCNKRSIKEGLKPYYNIDKDNKDPNNICEYDDLKWTITTNDGANGYRLPTEEEWEYAAGGAGISKDFTHSGDNNADEVAWYWRNAGDNYLTGDWNWGSIEGNNTKTHTIGSKKPNELGLYDMSGNVREWCWDWYQDDKYEIGFYRVWKGGGWIGEAISSEISYRGKFEANGKGSDQGLRLCRDEQVYIK